jgi:hypothetical protein
LSDEAEIFIENTISPKFKKVYLLNESDIENLDKISTTDYIDLFISNNLLINNRKLRRKLEILLESGNFASVEYIDDINVTEETNESKSESTIDDRDSPRIQLDYKEFISEYIKSQSYDSEKVKHGIITEYNNIIKIYDEGYSD